MRFVTEKDFVSESIGGSVLKLSGSLVFGFADRFVQISFQGLHT